MSATTAPRPQLAVDLVCTACGYGIAGRLPPPPLCAMCHAEGCWEPLRRPLAGRVPARQVPGT